MFPRYDQFRHLLSCVILLDLNIWIAVCNKADSCDRATAIREPTTPTTTVLEEKLAKLENGCLVSKVSSSLPEEG